MEKIKILSLLTMAGLSVVIGNTTNALPTLDNRILQNNQSLTDDLETLTDNDSYEIMMLASSNYGCNNNGGCGGQESCRRV